MKMSEDYADEFQCEQYMIVSSQVKANTIIEKINDSDELYFGTNECLEGKDITIETTEITEEQEQFLESVLGSTFGTGILSSVD